MVKIKCIIFCIIASATIVGCVSQNQYDQIETRNTELENQVEELQKTIKQKDLEIQALKGPNQAKDDTAKEDNSTVVKEKEIEVTVENFNEYFVFDQKIFIKKNAFGDLERAYYYKQYVLKDEYAEGLDYNASELYIKVLPKGLSVIKAELDLQNETGKVLEEINKYPYEDGEKVIRLQRWLDFNNRDCGQDLEEFYYYQFGGYSVEIPETQENTVEVSFDSFIWYDPEIIDFTGSLVYK